MRWLAGLAIALCVAGAFTAAHLWQHWRRIMKGFVSGLFGRIMSINVAVLALAALIATAVTPYLRTALSPDSGTAVDATVIAAVVEHAGSVLANVPPTYAAVGIYTAAEVQVLTEELVSLTRTVLASYLPADGSVPMADVDRLLGAVATRISANLSST